jgi:secreted trypsin-like serine protease
VGALLFDGEPDCSGVLVAPRTVLTAGHCVYEQSKERMTVRFGKVATNPANDTKEVESLTYPRGEDGITYIHSGEPQNDVGLVYLKNESAYRPFPLHQGDPSIAWLSSEKRPLDFNGFGYNIVDGSRAAAGVKRQARMTISDYEATRFFYGDGIRGSCKGDSGGPAFYLDERNSPATLKVVGITSSGRLGCRGTASDMRIDAYMEWIRPRLR